LDQVSLIEEIVIMTNKDTPSKRAKVIGETAKSTAARDEQVPDSPSSPDIAAEEKVEEAPMATRAPRPAAKKLRMGPVILFVLIVVAVAAAIWWFAFRGAGVPAKPAAGDSGGAPSGCQQWNKISADDVGQQLCAYGVVTKAYTGKGITYIRFSDEKDSFRFLNPSGKDFSKTVGQCVSAEGVVKAYGKMPYIEIGDKLDSCK
jgi:hypothetical protein